MRMRMVSREAAQQTTTDTSAERQRRWYAQHPELANQRSLASKAKKPELYQELHRRAIGGYRSRQREHAALVAAAAEVTALWLAGALTGDRAFEDAIARLDALLPEKTP